MRLTTEKKAELIESAFGKPAKEVFEELYYKRKLSTSEMNKEISTRIKETLGVEVSNRKSVYTSLFKSLGLKKRDPSEAMYARWDGNDEWREKQREKILKQFEETDLKQRVINGTKKRFEDKDYRSQFSEEMKKRWENNPNMTTRGIKEYWADPEKSKEGDIKRTEGTRRNYLERGDEIRAKISSSLKANKKARTHISVTTSNRLKELWKDEDYRKITLERLRKTKSRKSGNNLENTIKSILEELEIEFVEQKRVRYTEKHYFYPDFYIPSINGIIEVQGDYWHANPKMYNTEELDSIQLSNLRRDSRKKLFYKDNGFKLLYLWGFDIKNNPESVKYSIKDWLEPR